MHKFSFAALALGLSMFSGLVLTPALGADTGLINFTFDAPHRDRLVQAQIFFPADHGGRVEWVGDNAVFRGVLVKRDAIPDGKRHPLVVISHGSGGNAASLAWLATSLVEAGYVVAIPNHQGSTSGDSTPETTIPAVWLRPADISNLLDALQASTSVSQFIDFTNVTGLGFSLGGAAVMKLAGAEHRADKLADFCAAHPQSIGCPWLDKGNALIPGHVDLGAIDASKFNPARRDERLARFVLVDPGFLPAVADESLAGISAKVEFLNLGEIESLPIGLSADAAAKSVPHAHYDFVSGANHFDFLAECKTLGWFYVWMEGDDPVCTERGSRSRTAIHDEVAHKIIAFLGAN